MTTAKLTATKLTATKLTVRYQKGAIPVIFLLLAAVAVLAFGLAGYIPTAEFVPDPSCQPGKVLLPTYKTLRCEVTEGYGGVYYSQTYTGADCPWGYQCVKVTCPPVLGGAEQTRCLFKIANRVLWRHSYESQFKSGPAEFMMNWGDTALVVYNPGLFETPATEIWYRTKVLSMYTSTGIFAKKMCDTCDLSCIIGTEAFNNLPPDQQLDMKVGDTTLTIDRYVDYVLIGNFFDCNGRPAQCVKTGSRSSVAYSLDKLQRYQACYYIRGAVIAQGECCPGETEFGYGCNSNTLTFETGPGACCIGGICSVERCPGRGDWAWEEWKIGQSLKKYICKQSAGACEVADIKYGVMCNPSTGYGCPATQRCDPVTLTCTDRPVVVLECVETGRECCIAGEVPANVKPRSCEEAGKPGQICINGFCRKELPVSLCDYDGVCEDNEDPVNCPDCSTCNWLCQLQKFLWLWVVGMLVIGAVLLVVSIFVPLLRVILLTNPLTFMLIVAILGALLAFVFAVPVASLGATILPGIL